MRTLVILFTTTLFFMMSFTWVNDSAGGGSDLPPEIQSILKEIRKHEELNKSRSDLNLSGEKKALQGKEENAGLMTPSATDVFDTAAEQMAESQSPSIDLLERAAIRYRNMIEQVSREDDLAKGVKSYSDSIPNETEITEKGQLVLPGLNAESSFGPGATGKTEKSASFPASTEQTQSQLSGLPKETCQQLQEMLEIIYARLNTMHQEISYFYRP